MNPDRHYKNPSYCGNRIPLTRYCLLHILVILLLPAAVLADIASANLARESGDLEGAIREYRTLAQSGNAIAQASLGYMYHMGEGVEQDPSMAVHWYRSAAHLGNADAQYNLAVAYAFGEGISRDNTSAVDWYKKAAAQEHAIAQYSLGLSYSYGEGIDRDLETAAYWLSRSAENGYVRAQVLLASKYHTGNGLPLNYPEAARWYRAAAEQDDAIAQFNLASLYRSGTGIEKDLDEALKWYRVSAQQGFGAAEEQIQEMQRILAINRPDNDITTGVNSYTQQPMVLPPISETGLVDINNDDSHLEDTSEIDDVPDQAEAELIQIPTDPPIPEQAVINSTPLGLDTDIDRKPEINLEQLVKNISTAIDELSRQNFEDAIPLFRSAANKGEPSAQYHLATLYYQGLGLDINYETAALWFRRAAAQGNADAQFSIGNMYLMGEGMPQSDSQARYWYQQAANKGHSSAQHNLQNLNRLSGFIDPEQNYSME